MNQDELTISNKLERVLRDFFIQFHLESLPLSEKSLRLLISPWCHYFAHSSFAKFHNHSNYQSSTDLRNAPGDTLAFMEYFRTTNYSDYLDKSLENVFQERFFREETESLRIPKNYYSKTQIYQPGFSKNFSLKLCLFSIFRIQRIKDRRVHVFFNVDASLRTKVHERLSKELIANEFSTWFSDRAIELFPKSLLEGLPFLLLQLEKHPKKDCLFSSDSWHILDGWRIYAASQRDKGAKLLGSPHAINHGCSTHFWLRDFELDNLDAYYTWGWNQKSKISVTPFFTPKFSGKKRPTKINVTGKNILISSAARPTHLLEQPYAPGHFEKYLNEQIHLACQLEKHSQQKVFIRTRPKDLGWDLQHRVSLLNNPNIAIEFQTGKFIDRLNGSALHICDNTSTTIIESLWLNHPTLILITGSYFDIRNESMDEFNFLKEAGVLHNDIESLICQFNLIKKDINLWWSTDLVQESVVKFLRIQGKPNGQIKDWKKVLLN